MPPEGRPRPLRGVARSRGEAWSGGTTRPSEAHNDLGRDRFPPNLGGTRYIQWPSNGHRNECIKCMRLARYSPLVSLWCDVSVLDRRETPPGIHLIHQSYVSDLMVRVYRVGWLIHLIHPSRWESQPTSPSDHRLGVTVKAGHLIHLIHPPSARRGGTIMHFQQKLK